MRILFLDDSFQKKSAYFGYGGFCIEEKHINALTEDMCQIKNSYKIPNDVEMKWSPGPEHYLRKEFKGNRQELNIRLVSLLEKYSSTTLCAVTDFSQIYGKKYYNWNNDECKRWAIKESMKFIFERYENSFLEKVNDIGIVVIDSDNIATMSEGIGSIQKMILEGTKYQAKFKRVQVCPMIAMSKYCPPVQLADIIIGSTVSSLSANKYGIEIFNKVWQRILGKPIESNLISGACSAYKLGYGLKLFPSVFKEKGLEVFKNIDKQYVVSNSGIRARALAKTNIKHKLF